jgi:hypothetical protein
MAALFNWALRHWTRFFRPAAKSSQQALVPQPSVVEPVPNRTTAEMADKHLALIDSRELPSTPERTPVLSYLTESADYYADLLIASAAIYDGPRLANEEISKLNNRYVMAEWGLIARGTDSIPFAIQMLESKTPEVREAGASVLASVGSDDEVMGRILETLEAEYHRSAVDHEFETLDTLISAVEQMKNKQAIPMLARLVRDANLNGDSRWAAVEALGTLARRRFEKQPDPIAAALEWLEKKGY